MTTPNRYDGVNGSLSIKEAWYGHYVRYEDYARLKAEVERLTPADEALKAYDEGEINEFIYWHLEWTSRNAAKQGGQQ